MTMRFLGLLSAALVLASGIAPAMFAYIYDVSASYSFGFAAGALMFALACLMLLALGRYPTSHQPEK